MDITYNHRFRPRGTSISSTALIAATALAALLVKSSSAQTTNPAPAEATVELTTNQLGAMKIETLGTKVFPVQKWAIGNIDYDEDLSVQVFSPYQGKIITNFANLGDDVKKGQPLYTIDSPDLIQAESTLIGALASYDLFSKEYNRAKSLYGTNGVSEREMEQATSDFQTADGAIKAARDAVRVFGKTDAEIDQVIASRKIDPVLVVPSPISGRITARFAQPGLLVQPGNIPAPYSVADLSTKWMVANVIESDSPLLRVGQAVKATVMAYPGRFFEGKVSAVGTLIDPNVHRLMLRCDIADTNNELRPGMLADFTIAIQDPVTAVAIPMNGVVRNSDGTFVAWVTMDRHRFSQRLIKVGIQNDDYYQVLDGLQSGDIVVTDGAIFISNILYAPPSD